jgi:glyoxylase-like metal-dependent hydrolase (beta-lactamase superfamily II)
MKKHIFILVLIALFSGIGGLLMADENHIVEKVNDHLYVIQGLGGNISFLITDEGVLLIDMGNSRKDGETVLEEIRRITDKPLIYVFLTHYHGDHVNGMAALPVHVPVIATEKTVENLKNITAPNRAYNIKEAYPAAIKDLKEKAQKDSIDSEKAARELKEMQKRFEAYKNESIRYPDETFETRRTLRLGDFTVELFLPGPAHTGGNAMAFIKEMNVLITGDNLFHNDFPYIDIRGGADPYHWITIAREHSKKGYDIIIPGHGPVAEGTEALARFADYLEYAANEVRKAKEDGLTEDEAVEKITMEPYTHLGKARFRENNIRVFYNIGGAPGVQWK